MFKPAFVPKKEHLFQEPEKVTKLAYIDKGHLRGYLVFDANEVTTNFYFAPTFITDVTSIRMKIPTRLNVQALEDVEVFVAEFHDVEKLGFERPAIIYLFLRFMELIYIFNSNRQLSLLYDTPIERYQKLFKERPKVVAHMPLQYIASYLGINPETLSRIRKKMAKEDL